MAVPQKTDTIAAVATPPGIGGIGIIRISGPDALPIMCRLFYSHGGHTSFQSHKLYYGTLRNSSGRVLDEILAVYMRGPATYTREDVVELHSHGSWLVVQAALAEVYAAGARPAEAGEFTKRAFLAGRIDLTKAEAVIDLLQAKTDGGVRLAVQQLQGKLLDEIEAIREALVRILAVVEVAIDFPDDDVEILDTSQLLAQLQQQVIDPIERLLRLADQGRVIREGIHVVIAGRPNVGKSSLLNGLLREDRALVTSIPGTTRDTIEEMISIRGIPVHLVDTAGIRAHDNQVEELGIERARRKLAEADLVLFLVDAGEGVTEQDRALYESIQGQEHLVVFNKVDLAGEARLSALSESFAPSVLVRISARRLEGLDDLQEAIYRKVTVAGDVNEQLSCAPNVRHKAILTDAFEACTRLRMAFEIHEPADLLAVELQTALSSLSDIVGLTTPEDVLEMIFSEFCIGK